MFALSALEEFSRLQSLLYSRRKVSLSSVPSRPEDMFVYKKICVDLLTMNRDSLLSSLILSQSLLFVCLSVSVSHSRCLTYARTPESHV